jgi:hypothetical protein
MQESTRSTNWIGIKEWLAATKGITFVSYVSDVDHRPRLAGAGEGLIGQADAAHRPRTYLSSADDPVLAKIWDNPADDIYDTL